MGVAPENGGPFGAIHELWDRVIASDPGLVRARLAISSALSMAVALAVGYGYASAIHDTQRTVLVTMMLGGVVSMMGAMALTGSAVWPKVRTAAFFPVAFGAGMLPGALVYGHTDLMLCVFVAVMFAAVWVRRFGPAFLNYGFMTWMGYFFASFLGARLGTLPALIADVAVGTAVTLLLSMTVLRTHPGRTVRRVQHAFDARARAVARACADLLEAAGDPRRTATARRRLHARGLRLAEAALMIEAWSTESGVLPEGRSAPAMRRRLLEAQLAIDELAHAADELAQHGGDLARPAARIAGHLARREYPAVLYAARPLLDDAPAPGAAPSDTSFAATIPAARSGASTAAAHALELLGTAALSLTALEHPDDAGAALGALEGIGAPHSAAARLARAAVDFVVLETAAEDSPRADRADPSAGDAEPPTERFVPAVSLMLGNLPGSAAVAAGLAARGAQWNPLRRAPLSTRQAVQVALAGALAIILGRQISDTRYYWAVLATFVTFTGTATSSETSFKAANRLFGTLVGLGLAIVLAEATAGHTMLMLTVIVLSVMCGFYVINVSYAGMVLFITILVAQLYSALHEFTPGFLVLRLEETSLGAAIGIAVGLFVLPTSTRDTVGAAERAFLDAVAAVLHATADAWEGLPADPPGLIRSMEDRMRQLALTARPLTRPLFSGDPTAARRRIALHAAAARRIRTLALLPVPATAPSTAAAPPDAVLTSAARPIAGLGVGAGVRASAGAASADPGTGAVAGPDSAAAAVAQTSRALARIVSALNEGRPAVDLLARRQPSLPGPRAAANRRPANAGLRGRHRR